MKRDYVLIVSPQGQKIFEWLSPICDTFDIVCRTTPNGLDAIRLFYKISPCLIIIDCHLPDINGMSLASILKDTESGGKSEIYLFNVKQIRKNTKADYFFISHDEKELQLNMSTKTQSFLEKLFMKTQHSTEIERAKINQYEHLPEIINNKTLHVGLLFSPYAELSGDGLDYWLGDEHELYGLLFDCAGHDIVSFTMAKQIRTLLKRGCISYQLGVHNNLSDILADVNQDLFNIDVNPEPTCALVFHINLQERRLICCTAGISPFFIKKYKNGNEMLEAVKLKNYPLGYEPDIEFNEIEIDLKDIKEIIFSSDGFYELLNKEYPVDETAKHDDVSAIIIRIKDKRQER